MELPPLIGHRGAAALAPENTIAGLDRAAQAGVGWVEIDTRLSGDDIPVVIHDETLERTTNGRGFVGDLSIVQLGALDAGSWFGPTFSGEAVPTLEMYLQTASDLGIGVNIEMKPDPRREGKLAGEVMDVIERVYRRDPPVLVSSFSTKALSVFRTLAPDIPRGWLCDRLPSGWRRTAKDLDIFSLHLNHEHLDAPILAQLKRQEIPLVSYTVNERNRAEVLRKSGVQCIISDHLDLFDEVIC